MNSKNETAISPQQSQSAQLLKEKKKKPEDSAGGWIVVFTDMMALMLTFFVMTYSMANPKQEIWDDLKNQVNMEFSKELGDIAERGEVNDISFEQVNFHSALDLSYLEALFTNQLIKRGLSDKVNIIPQPRQKRLILTIPSDLLFSSGSANINSNSEHMLKEIANILSGAKNSIEIVGHSDPTPISNPNNTYNSNWSLSLQRAINIGGALRENGYKRPFHIRGLSNTLYNSLPDTLPENKKMELSRRVDIVIYNKEENLAERLGL